MSSKHDNIRNAIAAIDAKIARLEHRRGELVQKLTGDETPCAGPTQSDFSTPSGGSLGLETPLDRALHLLNGFEGESFMKFHNSLPVTLKQELNSDDLSVLVQRFKELHPST